MRWENFRIKRFLSISIAAFLATSLIANFMIFPVLADNLYALRFDGTSDFVELPETKEIFSSGWETTKTVALWVKPHTDYSITNPLDPQYRDCTTTPSGIDVGECDSIFGDHPKFWGVSIGHLDGPNQNRIWVWNYDSSLGSTADFIGVEYTPGEWVHIALVHNNGMLRAYKNGVEYGSTPSGPTYQPPCTPPAECNILNLGGVITNQTRFWLFKGDIDEVSLWNRALSASEISANMYQDAPTNTTSLAAFYRMSNGSGTSLTDNNTWNPSCANPLGCTGTLLDGARGLPGNGQPAQWVTSDAFVVDGPSVTINKAASQADPTTFSPINFTVVFAGAVTDFTNGDVSLSGTALPTTAIVTGSGTTYNVAVSGMANSGTVIATINTGVAHDSLGRPNQPSTSTDNTVQFDTPTTGPTVTINKATGQADPTNTSPINFTVIFSQAVTGFATGDVNLSGTAGATTATVTGSGNTYNVAVSGMVRSGTVIAIVPPGVAQNAASAPNQPSSSTDNSVEFQDTTGPSVTINQAPGQRDPTATSPVHYQVIFSEPVDDFATTDVNLAVTPSQSLIVAINGSGTTYDVAVSGMTGKRTIIATISAGVVHDSTGNPNAASTSSDNSITYFEYQVFLPLTMR